ncbi:hemolysin family protein [Mycobacterium sp. WMMD1722]|uniref:hemolysin family protein n=1 Tax=Mycobacterium sp. WMMD1722 TaxID=3404117 RepID=UPI003BF527AC
MDDPLVVAVVTVALIASSAFFVASEFALIAARRHRLEERAARSRAARAALRSTTELSLLLAGAQLGITVCTLLLGAITKPAFHHAIAPLLKDAGLHPWLADAGSFVLALVIVTFLHLVIGEMAPKSWAIAHPERSAILLALPMRGFIWLTRPLLTALNRAANRCLRMVGVNPVDELAEGQDPAALKQLIEHSATSGVLGEPYRSNLTSALDLQSITVGDIIRRDLIQGSVRSDADPPEIQRRAKAAGHRRLLVRDGDDIAGVVHVRDSMAAEATATARDLMRPALALPAQTAVYEALREMRETRNHLVVVTENGAPAGLVTLTDVMHRLMPAPA